MVDDDMRNVFALDRLLERHGMNVLSAENGREAPGEARRSRRTSIAVLMDVMMPEMDGLRRPCAGSARTARAKDLPVIALTAKAMKGDREQCIEAGASDYITKPVDSDQLLSMLRVWLYR
ncbi:MAG: response regulator [Minicystis sp.]